MTATEGASHGLGIGPGGDQHSDVAGPHRAAGTRRVGDDAVIEQFDGAGNEVVEDQWSRLGGGQRAGILHEQARVGGNHAQLYWSVVAERVGHSVGRRRDGHEPDLGIAEGGAVEDVREPGEQLLVGAVVGGQLEHLRLFDGVEIGMHVGAAEPIDGLLGVADGDEHAVGECSLEHLPLQPIGVLELVDEHDAIALSELLGDNSATNWVDQRRVEPGDDGVVADLAARLLAVPHLGAGLVGEIGPPLGQVVVGVGGHEPGPGVGQHCRHRDDELAFDLHR